MAKKQKSLKLPKQIFVKREADPNDPTTTWLQADVTTETMENSDVVGVYELREVRTLEITRRLK